MCTISRRQAGFSLVELIFFIVIVGLGLAGILSVMNVSVARSADPMVRKQAMALADSLLEEILLKAYDDPDGVGGETTRDTFDDVGDFHGLDETLATPATGVFLNMPPLLDGYRIQVQVAADALDTVAARRVTVTVSRGGEAISMTGYRTNY
jgi:MSHA pilin protein MshD